MLSVFSLSVLVLGFLLLTSFHSLCSLALLPLKEVVGIYQLLSAILSFVNLVYLVVLVWKFLAFCCLI